MTDKQLSAGEVGLEVVGYTAQQDIDWQGDCALRKAPMLDYSIPLVRLSDAQRLLAAARLQTAMLATCAKNVADERDQLRTLLTAQPQASAAQSAPAEEREAFEAWCKREYEPRMGEDWRCVMYQVNHGDKAYASFQAGAAWQRAQSAPAGSARQKQQLSPRKSTGLSVSGTRE